MLHLHVQQKRFKSDLRLQDNNIYNLMNSSESIILCSSLYDHINANYSFNVCYHHLITCVVTQIFLVCVLSGH